MENKPTGGPVHPISSANAFDYAGMTLRDHFAGLAMQAMLSNMKGTGAQVLEAMPALAYGAYMMADDMIKQRSK